MSDKLTPDQLKEIIAALHINQPVMAYKVVGDRIELRLLGGNTAVFSEAALFAEGPPPELDPELVEGPVEGLNDLTQKQLRFLADKFMIPGRTKMKKAQLLDLLAEQNPDALLRFMDML